MAGQQNYYETDRALSEYLLFHYGERKEIMPPDFAAPAALNFPARCVSECLDRSRLASNTSALDLGCAVGRASFELARHCHSVVGIDSSESFVTIASHLQKNGSFLFGCIDEGELTRPCQAVVPGDIDRNRVRFECGDALNLPGNFQNFDVVLVANLIDRLGDPRRCLERLPALLKAGGQLIITSPYTWMQDYTPRTNWLGGFEIGGKRRQTLDALQEIFAPAFQFGYSKDLPFLIREHARKFQLCVAEASVWTRRD